MFRGFVTTILAVVLILPGALLADTVKGRIQYMSFKAKSIQIDAKGKSPFMVRFDKNTQYVNAKGPKELGTKDLIEVEYSPGAPATKITKVIFDLPRGVEIGTQELEAIIQGNQDYTLVDARPGKRFGDGHIPTAISIFAKDLEKNLDKLPQDKSKLLIFYCGGPTCPYTGMSIKIAQQHGYTNVKGYQAGLPTWKKAKKPVHASAGWVAKNLNEHHVVIDARSVEKSGKKHIKTAVAMPAGDFKAMTKTFVKEKKPARLPGVSDKGAPIIVYGDSDASKDALTAYQELKKWRYKKVAILEGGFDDWTQQGRPTASGPAADKIVYTRKLKKGAIPSADFVKLEQNRGSVTLLDVRSAKETGKGTLQGEGTLAIPLDDIVANLDKLPKSGEIVTYCSNGIRAEMAYETLKNHGYENVRFLNETLAVKSDGSFRIE